MQLLRPEARRLQRKWGSASRQIDGGRINNNIMVVVAIAGQALSRVGSRSAGGCHG